MWTRSGSGQYRRRPGRDANRPPWRDVTDAYPLSQGLAEIVAYFQLATESDWAAINPDPTQHLSWQLPDGSIREATIDQIIFGRPA